jgi:hypoxanthine phosphoribosyltransferase
MKVLTFKQTRRNKYAPARKSGTHSVSRLGDWKDKRILLVDDVSVSGKTLTEARRLLDGDSTFRR